MITAATAITIMAGDAFAKLLAQGADEGGGGVADGGGGSGGSSCCHEVQIESSPPPLTLEGELTEVELTTAHCSGVPVPPPLRTVVNPAASSIGIARALRPPDRQNNTKGLLLSAGSAWSGIKSGSILKSHSMEPAGGGICIFSPDERKSTRTPLDASAARSSDGVASTGMLVSWKLRASLDKPVLGRR